MHPQVITRFNYRSPNITYIIIFSASGVFFFSSRRRHTRYWRDWSSDVCSSDLFHQETASTGHQQAEQAGCGSSAGGMAERHPPGDVLDWQEDGPEPGVNGPNRIPWGVRDAGVKRASRQFAGILESQLGSQGQVVTNPDRCEGDEQGQPIRLAEKGSGLNRVNRGSFGRGRGTWSVARWWLSWALRFPYGR